MSIKISKIPKVPRVYTYIATFEPKVAGLSWFLLSISILQNQKVFTKYEQEFALFSHCGLQIKRSFGSTYFSVCAKHTCSTLEEKLYILLIHKSKISKAFCVAP